VVPEPENPKILRPGQRRGFDALASGNGSAPRNIILNAATGWGKSLLIKAITIRVLTSHPEVRALIAVPQTVIGANFGAEELDVPGVGHVSWFPRQLCGPCDDSKVEALKGFLRARSKVLGTDVNSNVMVCSHATIVKAFNSCTPVEREYLFRDVMIWFDEAHHVQNAESTVGLTVRNEAGKLIDFLLDHGERVGLATATFFRGDRTGLLSPEQARQFTRFDFPYDEYLSGMKYLKGFDLDFVPCGLDFVPAIESIAKDEIRKDIVFVPPTQTLSPKHRMGKRECVRRIVESYRKAFGGQVRRGPVFIDIVNEGRRLRIIDMVDERNREKKKAYINGIKRLPPEERAGALDVIIAMNTFKEGADWPWADRAIVVGLRKSLVENVQIVGRLLRDVPGKEHVVLKQLLPFAATKDESKLRGLLNDHVNAVCLTMLMEDVIKPVRIRVSIPGTSGTTSLARDWLAESLSDENDQLSVMTEAMAALNSIFDEDGLTGQKAFDEFVKRLEVILEVHGGATCHVREIGAKIWASGVRKGVDERTLEGFTFEQLVERNPVDGLKGWVAHLGFKSLKEIARAWKAHQAAENKRKLLAMPRGCKRPSSKTTVLGACLASYTRKSSSSYDPEFDKAIRKKQPGWFVNPADEAKRKLLEMPTGSEKPHTKGNPGYALNYCNKNHPRYDAAFHEKLQVKHPGWFVSKKRILLEMPIGSKKPHHKTSLGIALRCYVQKGNTSYDAEFDRDIREKHPDWWEKPQDKTKQTLMDFPVGHERPKGSTKLGAALSRYTTRKSDCYDSEFDKSIRNRQPGWFPRCEIKQELLAMPKKGGKPFTRKGRDARLGRALYRYTTKTHKDYDPVFDKAIRAKHPEWFQKSSDKTKRQLLGLPPNSHVPSGKANCLRTYTTKSHKYYDASFDEKIRKKQPQWFFNKVQEKKRLLLELPLAAPRPQRGTDMGENLARYTRRGSSSYDEKFHEKAKRRFPQWFRNADKTKKLLLEMPPGCERPSLKAISAALSSYTRLKSPCYDADFDRKIRARQPQWFVNTAEENKRKLLEMPIGSKKPHVQTLLGSALRRYTMPGRGGGSYDPGFTKKIRERQPQWFVTLTASNKQKLLEMPVGSKKPHVQTLLGSALRRYTVPGIVGSSYDADFDRKIRKRHPQWFPQRRKRK